VGEQPLPDRLRIGVRHLAAQEPDGETCQGGGTLPLGPKKVGGPTVLDAPLQVPKSRELRRLWLEIPGGDQVACLESLTHLADERGGDVRDRDVGRGRSVCERVA